jgi:hypothetical protein
LSVLLVELSPLFIVSELPLIEPEGVCVVVDEVDEFVPDIEPLCWSVFWPLDCATAKLPPISTIEAA